MQPHERRYARRFAIAIVSYALLLVLSIWLLRSAEPGIWRIPLAVLPCVPLVYGVLAYVRYLGEIDELQQLIQLQAICFAAGLTGLLTFTYGLLENAGFPQISYVWVFPAMVALWGSASMFLQWRYGS